MTESRSLTWTSATAALGYLAAGIGRPALDYASFHEADPRLLSLLLMVSLGGIAVGAIAHLALLAAMRRAQTPAAATTSRRAAILRAVAIAVACVVLGAALYEIRRRLGGEGRMWLDMAMHAVFLIPAAWAALFWLRRPSTAAGA